MVMTSTSENLLYGIGSANCWQKLVLLLLTHHLPHLQNTNGSDSIIWGVLSITWLIALPPYLIFIKNPTPKVDCSGIYRIECGECRVTYIGQKGWKFKTRLNEHIGKPSQHLVLLRKKDLRSPSTVEMPSQPKKDNRSFTPLLLEKLYNDEN